MWTSSTKPTPGQERNVEDKDVYSVHQEERKGGRTSRIVRREIWFMKLAVELARKELKEKLKKDLEKREARE